ncbi:hypothetical protein HN51_002327 [Arachis hypogaea]|uniref:Uncharacterized protein n=2 Tax=Arachis TaxID=3817 RepID=A0A445EMU4_ARAHY|nr:uncharacterized protein LOC107461084 [Arachis duranensis]XP_025607701.1 uncharacterized protein LOC112701117 [Arachis hypogaea]QHO50523.1 uncharacterized protein DS421_1g23190 [Arachis hypogaea]RYR76770.1 hypothetical protein Ahy_A01g001326 isoform A [Arachis hypogaea]
MAATGADGVFRAVYEGCISGYDNCVQRRPYHRNCGCALHNNNNNRKHCSHMLQRCDKVSYPMRRAWSEGNLVMATPPSSSSPSSSHSSSVAAAASGDMPRLSLFKEEEEEE